MCLLTLFKKWAMEFEPQLYQQTAQISKCLLNRAPSFSTLFLLNSQHLVRFYQVFEIRTLSLLLAEIPINKNKQPHFLTLFLT